MVFAYKEWLKILYKNNLIRFKKVQGQKFSYHENESKYNMFPLCIQSQRLAMETIPPLERSTFTSVRVDKVWDNLLFLLDFPFFEKAKQTFH